MVREVNRTVRNREAKALHDAERKAAAKPGRDLLAERIREVIKDEVERSQRRHGDPAKAAATRLYHREKLPGYGRWATAESGEMAGKRLPFIDVDAAEIGKPGVYRAFHGTSASTWGPTRDTGVSASGMTRFIPEMSDDGLTFFLARQRPVAESYTGVRRASKEDVVDTLMERYLDEFSDTFLSEHGSVSFGFKDVVEEYGLLDKKVVEQLGKRAPTVTPERPGTLARDKAQLKKIEAEQGKLRAEFWKHNAGLKVLENDFAVALDAWTAAPAGKEAAEALKRVDASERAIELARAEKIKAGRARRDYREDNEDRLEELRTKRDTRKKAGILDLYVKMENPYVIDAQGAKWHNIQTPIYPTQKSWPITGLGAHKKKPELPRWGARSSLTPDPDAYDPTPGHIKHMRMKSREIAAMAHRDGYDGVIIKNVVDTMRGNDVGDVLITFDPLKLKLTENEGIYSRRNPYWGFVLPFTVGLGAMRETDKAE